MMKMFLLIFACVMIASCQKISNSVSVHNAVQSVVKISIEHIDVEQASFASESKRYFATGFSVLNDPVKKISYVITNKHVCDMRTNAKYRLFKNTGETLNAVFMKYDPFADLCILIADGIIPSLVLAKNNALQGDRILTIGSPAAVFPIAVEGFISGYHNINVYTIEDGVPFELHFRAQVMSAPIYQGSSGSPVLNSSGEVVGVVYAVKIDKEHISFIVPVSELLRFIDGTEYVSIG